MQTLLATLLKDHFPTTFGGHLEFPHKMQKCIYLGNEARESVISMKFLNHRVYAVSEFLRYSPDKIFTLKVTTARLKVKSWSDHNVAHLHTLTNVPTKYQLPTPYGFRDIALTRFYRSRSLRQGQRSNQGQTMMLHNYNP